MTVDIIAVLAFGFIDTWSSVDHQSEGFVFAVGFFLFFAFLSAFALLAVAWRLFPFFGFSSYGQALVTSLLALLASYLFSRSGFTFWFSSHIHFGFNLVDVYEPLAGFALVHALSVFIAGAFIGCISTIRRRA